MKWIKRIALGLVSLVVLAVATVFGVSEARMRKTYDVAAFNGLTVTKDPAQIARGQHLVTAVAKCVDCHTADLGGKVFIEPGPMGTVIAPNLTTGRGGVLAGYSDAQIEAAIRHGVRSNGRGLLIMPSDEYQNLSDADVSAIIAYLRALPAVDREFQQHTRLGPIGRGLITFGVPVIPAARIDHSRSTPRPAVPPVGATKEYGEYLVSVGGCRGCHSPTLAGQKSFEPGAPPSANITPAGQIGQWTEAQFMAAMRTGRRPDGTQIKDFMPWRSMARHTDDELRAIYMYLRTVPAVQSPARS
jgi:cytochrome c553